MRPAGRYAQGLLLLLLGVALAKLSAGAQLLRYVRPGTRWEVATAAVAIAAIGLHQVVHQTLGPGEGGGGHAHRPSRAAWLVLAPLLAIGVVAPPALNPLSAARPLSAPEPSSGFGTLPSTGPLAMTISELVLRSVWDHSSGLHGRRIRVIGFVVRTVPHGVVIARLVITCCAADATPYDLEVLTSRTIPPNGTWVAASGRFDGQVPGEDLVPRIDRASVRGVPAPEDPYEGRT